MKKVSVGQEELKNCRGRMCNVSVKKVGGNVQNTQRHRDS